MTVDSFNMEFGYELLSAVPYAYELYLRDELTETISAPGSGPLYYFSPSHKINPAKRSWYNTERARLEGLLYTFIHQPEQPKKFFPCYKEAYSNSEFKFDKPILCICNRYNKEWDKEPINYFDLNMLEWLFTNLKDHYEVIYFPVNLPEKLQDNEHSLKLADEKLAKKHDIKIFTSLLCGRSWNKVLLRVFANCDFFVTMNGGYAILASFFSGTNIIYSKPGKPQAREIDNKSFWRWYPNINNVRTLHVPGYTELKEKVQALYIDKKPCINILVRTHRPHYLERCVKSIEAQSYENINLVFISDNEKSIKATRVYNGRLLTVNKICIKPEKPEGPEYGKFFPYNSYLDIAQRLVHGYIMFLDDDDQLINSNSLDILMSKVSHDRLTLWKVNMAGKIIPSYSFNNSVELYDVTGIGFCYHSAYVDYTDWSPWKRADYRTAKKLSSKLELTWLDEVLTKIQDCPGNGVKADLPTQYKLTYPDGRIERPYFTDAELLTIKDSFKRQNICIEQMK